MSSACASMTSGVPSWSGSSASHDSSCSSRKSVPEKSNNTALIVMGASLTGSSGRMPCDVFGNNAHEHAHDVGRLGREGRAGVLAGQFVVQLAAAFDADLGAAADLDVVLGSGQVEDGERDLRVAADVALLAPALHGHE